MFWTQVEEYTHELTHVPLAPGAPVFSGMKTVTLTFSDLKLTVLYDQTTAPLSIVLSDPIVGLTDTPCIKLEQVVE